MPGFDRDRSCRAWRWLQMIALAALLQAPLSGAAGAAALFITPATQTVGLGQQVALTVQVSDVLPAGLGAYDFTLRYDPAVLGFASVDDAQGLGTAIGLAATDVGAGVLLSDFSFELTADLLALQSPDFALFTIYFNALSVGSSALTVENLATFDAAGHALAYGASGAMVTVAPPASRLPEPGGLALVGLALLAMACSALWRRQRRR